MRRWRSGALANNGILFKPSGLNEARFDSVNGSSEPRVDVEYQRRCD